MSSELLTFRYRSGEIEYRTSDQAPKVGDVLTRNGDDWIVEEVTAADDGTTVVTLRPGPKPVQTNDDEA